MTTNQFLAVKKKLMADQEKLASLQTMSSEYLSSDKVIYADPSKEEKDWQ